MKKLNIFLICIFIICFRAEAIPINNYLSKPTGTFGVGFQDFHWINTNICPDPNFNGKNSDDFSSENKKFCHEIMVRIYYPSETKTKLETQHYQPLVQSIQRDLAKTPGVSKEQLLQLNEIKSFSVKNLPIILGKKFPVILFSPGNGSPAEMYENFIVELVSHGYIVIGINSTFISGDVELPNKHIVKFNIDQTLPELLQIPPSDFSYVYNKIHTSNKSNPLFSAMDLQHIGALGQSLGGEIVARAAHTHPHWFQAAATLDSGICQYDDTLRKFTIPFMRQISANRKCELPSHTTFQLGKDGFLVVISPNEKNHDFSYHLNFTDYSTLQYLPAEQIALQQNIKSIMGKGNGWEITNSINIYLLQFFNTYLKDEKNLYFKKQGSLVKNTFVEYGVH